MLQVALQERPEDPFIHYNLGSTCMGMNRLDEALTWFERGLKRADLSCAFLPMLYAQLTELHRRKGRIDEALAVCRAGRENPLHVELLFQEALLYEQAGDDRRAEACLRQLIDSPNEQWYGGGDVGGAATNAQSCLSISDKNAGPRPSRNGRRSWLSNPICGQPGKGSGNIFATAALGRHGTDDCTFGTGAKSWH